MIPRTFIDYYGDQTRWFIGEVINVADDPLQLGRAQVRAFGVYDDIKDEDLPWAQVVIPITTGIHEGKGQNLGLLVGTQVFGIFLDGQNSQLPMVIGSVPKEGDTNEKAKENYPLNKVYETEGVNEKTGHIKEYDDTAGYERIHERHSSGTFYQMGPSGELVTNVKQNEYRKVEGQRITEIGTISPKIDPDLAEIFSKSDIDINNYFTEETVVHGKRVTTIEEDETLVVEGDKYTVVVGNDELNVTGNVKINVTGSAKIDVTENVNVVSKKSIDLTAPEVTVRGSTIKLNS